MQVRLATRAYTPWYQKITMRVIVSDVMLRESKRERKKGIIREEYLLSKDTFAI